MRTWKRVAAAGTLAVFACSAPLSGAERIWCDEHLSAVYTAAFVDLGYPLPQLPTMPPEVTNFSPPPECTDPNAGYRPPWWQCTPTYNVADPPPWIRLPTWMAFQSLTSEQWDAACRKAISG